MITKKQKILITGVYGFLGSNLFTKLSKLKNLQVLGIGRNRYNLKLKNTVSGSINIKNLNKLKLIPDTIIHCAGEGSVSSVTKKYGSGYFTTKKLLNFYKKKKIKKFILISSAAVYGGGRKIRPISLYGKQKLLIEKLCKSTLKNKEKKLIILRVFSLYGPGLKKQLFWDVCKKIKKVDNIFFGTGNEVRSWVYIDDLINIIYKICEKKIKSAVLDISGKDNIENKDLIKKIYNSYFPNKKNNLPLFSGKKKKRDPKIMKSYKKKINKKFINYFTNLEDGIERYIKWFKKIK